MTTTFRKTLKLIRRLHAAEDGATVIEYGLLAALLSVACITAMNGLGTQLKSTFNATANAMSTGNTAGA